MTRHLLTSALFAGAAAGLIVAALQLAFVIPLLLEGELFETGQRLHFTASGSPQSVRAAPPLGDDFARHGITVAFGLITFVGFGLILQALMFLGERRGLAITARSGLIWGFAGFIAVHLAPALGLPPELPGTPTAAMGPRQVWWLATVLSTAAGMGLIAFTRGMLPLAGVALLAAPHIIGAPQLDTYWGVAPPELASHFVTLSLGAAAAGWAALGFFCGWFWTRANA